MFVGERFIGLADIGKISQQADVVEIAEQSQHADGAAALVGIFRSKPLTKTHACCLDGLRIIELQDDRFTQEPGQSLRHNVVTC